MSAVHNYMVRMSADDEHGRLGRVHLYGAEPEVEAGVLVAQANVPQQHVHRAIRQKELQQQNRSVYNNNNNLFNKTPNQRTQCMLKWLPRDDKNKQAWCVVDKRWPH